MVECLVANENVRSSTLLSCSTHTNNMYRVYYTDPETGQALGVDVLTLTAALERCEQLREYQYQYVTMVSDYADMVGKAGVSGAGTEYVPQLKN